MQGLLSPGFLSFRPRFQHHLFLLLFTPLSILLQGYIYGYHDHAIQIPYIHWRNNSSLYPGDPLPESFPYYFTLFWDTMAYLARYLPLYPLMLVLHVIFRWLLLESIYHFALELTGKRSTALLASSFFIMPLHCLGDFFPSPDFVHSCVAVPGLLYAITEFISGRNVIPLVLLGVLYNVHAMHSAFVTFIILAVIFANPQRLRSFNLWASGILGAGLASPTILAMFSSASIPAGESWIQAIRLRASHHIFPFTWTWPWISASIFFVGGFFCWRKIDLRYTRSLCVLLAAVGAICITGTIGSELEPTPFIMRMHAFRSALYAIFLFAVIWAHFLNSRIISPKTDATLGRGLIRDCFLSSFMVASLIVSSYIPLLGGLILLSGRSSLKNLVLGATVLLVPAFAFGLARLGFHFPVEGYLRDEFLKTILVAVLSFPLLVIFVPDTGRLLPYGLGRFGFGLSVSAIAVLSVGTIWYKANVRAKAEESMLLSDWIDVQQWAAEETSVEERFIVPPQLEGFRVYSRRGIVASWKDGTAAFWYPPMAEIWLERMVDLKYIDASGHRTIAKYGTLTGRALVGLGRKYGARFAVLKKPSNVSLPCIYENAHFKVIRLDVLRDPSG